MPSIFTKIIAGEIPGEFIFKDDLWVAFLDLNPVHPGHALLVPRAESTYLAGLPPETLAALGDRLARLTGAVKRVTGCPAVNVVLNDGPDAGQAVPHAHLHVLPRFRGDGKLAFPKGSPYAPGGMAAMGAKLRATWGG